MKGKNFTSDFPVLSVNISVCVRLCECAWSFDTNTHWIKLFVEIAYYWRDLSSHHQHRILFLYAAMRWKMMIAKFTRSFTIIPRYNVPGTQTGEISADSGMKARRHHFNETFQKWAIKTKIYDCLEKKKFFKWNKSKNLTKYSTYPLENRT